jgi:hypothetical protein
MYDDVIFILPWGERVGLGKPLVTVTLCLLIIAWIVEASTTGSRYELSSATCMTSAVIGFLGGGG